MRRNRRVKDNTQKKSVQDKIIMYSIIGVAALAIILVGLLMYSKQLSDEVEEGTMTLEQMSNVNNQTNTNTESVSTDVGKSVEEAENEMNSTNNTNTNTATNTTTNTKNSTNTSINITKQNETKTTNTTSSKTTEKKEETKKELSFQKPVDGEIMKGYAKDNLVYSETLQEWTTHLGIDIKAEKTTVVKAAEAGTVKSIKNDPRYGLTIVIEHNDGYETVYSNLLSSEFVVEGEKVERGQSIGTVGNTAAFEVADEPHLHFEILKDSIPIDPTTYMK